MHEVWIGPAVALLALILTVPFVRFLQKKSSPKERKGASASRGANVGKESAHRGREVEQGEVSAKLNETELRLRALQEALTTVKGEVEALGKTLRDYRRTTEASAKLMEQPSLQERATRTNVLMFDYKDLSQDPSGSVVDLKQAFRVYREALQTRGWVVQGFRSDPTSGEIRNVLLPLVSTFQNMPTHEPPKDQLSGVEVPDTPEELLKGKRRTAKEKVDED